MIKTVLYRILLMMVFSYIPSVVYCEDFLFYEDKISNILKYYNLEKETPVVKSKIFDIYISDILPIVALELSLDDYIFGSDKKLLDYIYDKAYKEAIRTLLIYDYNSENLDVRRKKIIFDSHDGMRDAIYFDIINKENQILDDIKKDLFKSILVSESEIEEYYNLNTELFTYPKKFKIRHILLKSNDKDASLLRERMDVIKAKLDAGESFGLVAEKYSENNASNKAGGQMGEYMYKKDMMYAFRGVVSNLAVGEYSDIFETHIGLNIIKLDGVEPPLIKTLDEVSENISLIINKRKEVSIMDSHLDLLIKKYRLKVVKPR